MIGITHKMASGLREDFTKFLPNAFIMKVMTERKKASVRTKRKYKPFVDLLVQILYKSQSRSRTDRDYQNAEIVMKWQVGYTNKPEWWPNPKRIKKLDTHWEATYTVDRLLDTLYSQGLSDIDSRTLFKQRLGEMVRLAFMEKEFEINLEREYNVG